MLTTNQSVGSILQPPQSKIVQIGQGGFGRILLVESPAHKFIVKELSENTLRAQNNTTFSLIDFATAETLPMNFSDAFKDCKNIVKIRALLNHMRVGTYLAGFGISSDMFVADSLGLYIIMDHMNGSDMKKVLETNGCLSPFHLTVLLYQISNALDHLHKRGVIHRDIKPENIFMNEFINEVAYVLFDFGVATLKGTPLLCSERICLGSSQYIAPEQARGFNDAPSDIYALGICAIELLTNYIPFDSLPPLERILVKQRQSPIDNEVNSRWPKDVLSTKLLSLITTCVEINPSNRPTAAELKTAALEILKSN